MRQFEDAEDGASVISRVVGGLVDNIKERASDKAYGWILHFVGLGGDESGELSAIENTLETIEAKIDALSTQLESVEAALLLAVQWGSQTTAVSQAVSGIDFKFKQLFKLSKNDQAAATTLQTAILDDNDGAGPALNMINSYVQDGEGGLSPGEPGLLNLFINANATRAMSNYVHGHTGTGTPLDTATQTINKYFLYLAGIQLKGTVLLINAYTEAGELDLAKSALDTYRANLAAQANIFRAGLELLTVTYCYDLTLLGLFSGPNWATSPMLLADQTICSVLAHDELIVRVWGGIGTGPFPFNTGTFVSNNTTAGATLTMTGGASPVSSLDETGDFTLFPASNNSQWSMYRYRFPSPGTGTYSVSPGVPDVPHFNCWVNAKGRFGKYPMTNPSFTSTADQRLCGQPGHFTGR